MRLLIREIADTYVRENFKRLGDIFRSKRLLNGEFEFFEITVPAATANFRFKHGLRFTPRDVIQTSVSGTGALTWNYDNFDGSFLDLTTTGPVTVRAFIGLFLENSEL